MVFAISATAVRSSSNFRKMKRVINALIDEYGSNSIHYGVLTFGDTPKRIMKFSKTFPGDEDLKRFISGIQQNTDGSALDKALEVCIIKLL